MGLQGNQAGICTRFVAFLFDVLAVVFVYTLFVNVVQFLVSTLSGHEFKISDLHVVSWLTLTLWAIFYCAYPVAAGGRTFGMAVWACGWCAPTAARSVGARPWSGVLALPLSFSRLLASASFSSCSDRMAGLCRTSLAAHLSSTAGMRHRQVADSS